jgi:hypothetical protein
VGSGKREMTGGRRQGQVIACWIGAPTCTFHCSRVGLQPSSWLPPPPGKRRCGYREWLRGMEEKYSEISRRGMREGVPKSQSSLRALSVSSYRSLPSPCLPPRSAGAPLRARDRLSLLPSSPSRTKPAIQRQNSMAVGRGKERKVLGEGGDDLRRGRGKPSLSGKPTRHPKPITPMMRIAVARRLMRSSMNCPSTAEQEHSMEKR